MGSLGKVFGPIAAILAIAAAVLSFMISKQREGFVGRAADLSTGVASIAQKLDSGTNSGTASSVSFTAGEKEDGSLGWPSYKENPSGYKSTIDKVVSLAGSVNSQRGDLAKAVSDMGIALGLSEEDMAVEDLNKLSAYADKAKEGVAMAQAVKARDAQMAGTLVATARALGYNLNPRIFSERETKTSDEGDVSIAFNCKPGLTGLEKATQLVADRSKAMETAMKGLPQQMTAYNDWSTEFDNLGGKDYAQALASLQVDCQRINARLEELAKAKVTIADLKETRAKLENQVAKLETDLKKANEDKEEMEARLRKHGDDSENIVKKMTDKSKIDYDLRGKVLLFNPEWNYVIIDMGHDKVMMDMTIAISYEGKYLASARIVKLEEKISMAEIITASKNLDIPVGAVVVLSGEDMADN